MVVKAKDFVQISYTAKLKDGKVFDTTDETLAKEEHLHNQNAKYGPKVICVGEHQVIPGLDKALVGKSPGEKFTVEIAPEDAFGPKNPKMIKIVQTSILTNQKINPVPGMQIQVPGMVGLIRTVSGGRTTIDFNHPLAGKDLIYDVEVLKIVEDDLEKVKGSLAALLNLSEKEYKIQQEGKKVRVAVMTMIPAQLKDAFKSRMKDLIPALELEFA